MNVAKIQYFAHNNSKNRMSISLGVTGSLEESSFATRMCGIEDVLGNCTQLAPVLVLLTVRDGNLLKSNVSEICIKLICVNQEVGVISNKIWRFCQILVAFK